MTPRILQSPLQAGPLTLSRESSHHLIRVLRCQAGDPVVLFDGQGQEASARIHQASADACGVVADTPALCLRESPITTVLIQSLCLADKMDWVVQKACELGVATVYPLAAARSQLRLDGDRAAKRQAHWQRVAEAAAAQCGRSRTPEVRGIGSLESILREYSGRSAQGLLLDPLASESISNVNPASEVWVAVGPESGWTDAEEQQFRSAGFAGIRMGPRILRTETVASVVLTALAIRAGEF